jgi:tripartite ATP-independent transporter DctM subunit
MDVGIITIIMFGLMLLLLSLGLPIVFVLGGTALIFAIFAWGPASMNVVILNANELMNSTILVSVAFFIFMAYMLEKSGVGEGLYELMYRWMGPLRGGLALGTIVASAVIAAMSGISTTGVVLMGIIGLPPMLKRNYDRLLAVGSIMAGGTLGPLIPPSLIIVLYGFVSGESIGKLFLGGVIPGLIISMFFCGYILLRCYLNPSLGPALLPEERATWEKKIKALRGLIIPILLVISVLGTLFLGIATPTEASAVGALGSIVSAAIHGKLNWKDLKAVAARSLKTIGFIMWIIYAAGCFAAIYQGLGISGLLQNMIGGWEINKWVVLVLIQLVWLVMGCLMDSGSILMITAPIFLPIAKLLDFNLLWFGLLFSVNTEMGLLTPPFGINLFIMRGIAPPEISTKDLYRSVFPFISCQMMGLILIMIFPEIVIWLPNLLLTR